MAGCVLFEASHGRAKPGRQSLGSAEEADADVAGVQLVDLVSRKVDEEVHEILDLVRVATPILRRKYEYRDVAHSSSEEDVANLP